MDALSIVIICAIVALCVGSIIYGYRRSLDNRANQIQRNDPETARALREAQRNIDLGKSGQGRRL